MTRPHTSLLAERELEASKCVILANVLSLEAWIADDKKPVSRLLAMVTSFLPKNQDSGEHRKNDALNHEKVLKTYGTRAEIADHGEAKRLKSAVRHPRTCLVYKAGPCLCGFLLR